VIDIAHAATEPNIEQTMCFVKTTPSVSPEGLIFSITAAYRVLQQIFQTRVFQGRFMGCH